LLLNDENFIGKLIVDLLSIIKNALEDSEGFLYGFFGQCTMNGDVGCGMCQLDTSDSQSSH
jgi:hypothetical protein